MIDLIRGENVSRALNILKFTEKRAADPIAKCLNSAIANATYKAEQENIAIDPDDLWVRSCFVDMGPTKNRRRMRPAPQGRAYREQRHYCHITIEVTSEEKPKTEAELLQEERIAAAKARRAAAPKKEKKKAAPKVEAEAKVAVADAAAEEAVEETVAVADAVAEETAEETVAVADAAAEETVEEAVAVADAEAEETVEEAVADAAAEETVVVSDDVPVEEPVSEEEGEKQ